MNSKGRRHWTVSYTGTIRLMIMFICWLSSVQTFQPITSSGAILLMIKDDIYLSLIVLSHRISNYNEYFRHAKSFSKHQKNSLGIVRF